VDPLRTALLWPARVIGVIVVTFLVATGTASVIAEFFQQEGRTTRFIAGEVRRVVVSTDTGDVTIRLGVVGTRTRLEFTRIWSFSEPRADATLVDSTLQVRGRCGRPIDIGACGVDIDLTLPPGVALDVSTGTGDITLIRPDARVQARSSVGNVSVQDARAAEVVASSDVGNLDLEFAEAPDDVRVTTDTGNAEVIVPDDGTAYAVDATSDTGETKIDIRTDPGSSRRLEVSSAVGTVRIAAR